MKHLLEYKLCNLNNINIDEIANVGFVQEGYESIFPFSYWKEITNNNEKQAVNKESKFIHSIDIEYSIITVDELKEFLDDSIKQKVEYFHCDTNNDDIITISAYKYINSNKTDEELFRTYKNYVYSLSVQNKQLWNTHVCELETYKRLHAIYGN